MNIMEGIQYGFKDKMGNNLIDDENEWNNEFNNFYYLQSASELLKSKCGICWDQVELERYLFNQNNIKCKTYFIFLDGKDYLPSHTFLVYICNNKYYWFEHSWTEYKGIHKYNSEIDLLNDVKEKFQKEHYILKNANIYLYENEKPKSHLRSNEFYKYIENQKRIYL